MQPFLLKPALKDYLWGGTKLKTQFGISTSMDILAESWELSGHADGSSTIEGGEFSGMPFRDFVKAHPEACGKNFKGGEFPILVKLIDAKGSLSIQVHPADAYAYEAEGESGKTEMWIVLQAEPQAFLYLGFDKVISKAEMNERIANNTLPEVLHKQQVKKGDVVFIPAGTIHAIGAGIVLAEVQQNSNSTYRVYDFGRVGADGKTRPLHIEKALDVTHIAPANPLPQGAKPLQQTSGGTLEILAECAYFTAERLVLDGEHKYILDGNSFRGVLCTQGNAACVSGEASLALQKGRSMFVPSDAGEFTLAGKGEFLIFWV